MIILYIYLALSVFASVAILAGCIVSGRGHVSRHQPVGTPVYVPHNAKAVGVSA